jgi:hypothetical protein
MSAAQKDSPFRNGDDLQRIPEILDFMSNFRLDFKPKPQFTTQATLARAQFVMRQARYGL